MSEWEVRSCNAPVPAQIVPRCPFPSSGKMWKLSLVCGLAAFVSYKLNHEITTTKEQPWNNSHSLLSIPQDLTESGCLENKSHHNSIPNRWIWNINQLPKFGKASSSFSAGIYGIILSQWPWTKASLMLRLECQGWFQSLLSPCSAPQRPPWKVISPSTPGPCSSATTPASQFCVFLEQLLQIPPNGFEGGDEWPGRKALLLWAPAWKLLLFLPWLWFLPQHQNPAPHFPLPSESNISCSEVGSGWKKSLPHFLLLGVHWKWSLLPGTRLPSQLDSPCNSN